MAPEERSTSHLVEVARRLGETAPQLGFFQLVAYLERLTTSAARVGGMGPVLQEELRFRHDPSLGFSSGDVAEVTLREVPAQADQPWEKRALFEVTTRFLGLTGSVSPLPFYLAEEVAQEDPDHAPRREFLDLFHHRLLSLLYRLQSKYRVTSEANSECTDQWSRRLLALAGFDTYEHNTPGRLPAWRLLRIPMLLAGHARTADRLETVLEDVLGAELEGARVRVEQFVGRWVDIDARLQLGRANHQLGRTTVLGGRALDRMGKIKLHVGPLSPEVYHRLLPGGDLQPMVREVVTLFLRDPLECEMVLELSEGIMQTFHLSQKRPARLGRDTWLGQARQVRINVPVL